MAGQLGLRRATLAAALALVAGAGLSCAVLDRWDAKPPRPLGPRSIRWVPDPASPGQAWVEARGLDFDGVALPALMNHDQGAAYRVLRVYALPASAATGDVDRSVPPMLGRFERVAENVIQFRPQFPLEPGMRYVAVLDPSQLPSGARTGGTLTATYVPPLPAVSPPAVVSRVSPGADTLPENLLKFYVHFSAPMSRGGVYRHVRLIDDAGREVELPFLELDEELWDPAMTRLTLFIDPGRIKRGVKPLEDIGPALEEGRRYTLVIDRGLIDAAGRELGAEFRKAFSVGPPDRDPPDPAKWTVTPPAASTRGPLTITFPDPMDRALAERLIRVTAGGRAVAGEASVGEGERRWAFTPGEPWRAGRYTIDVQPTVEDLAGNNVGKPFEVDLQAGGEGRPELPPVRLPFEIR